MTERIRRHRAARPSSWETVEAPRALREAVRELEGDAFAVLDCLTLWVSNLIEAGMSDDEIVDEAREIATTLAERDASSVVVTNEVGLGIVPMHEHRPPLPGHARSGERRVRERSRARLPRGRGTGALPRGSDADVTATLDAVVVRIPRPRDDAAREVRRLLDAKTKPPGSLGRLEELACRLAAIRGEVPGASLAPAIVVAAADHGVAAEGVSPYPQVVTGQMLANFANGGAAVSVLAREAGARLVVVDAGVVAPPRPEAVGSAVSNGVRGSGNIAHGPAMPRSVAEQLIERGIALAEDLAADGIGIVGVGDMGIANTTAASAVCAVLLPADPSDVCGPGTGLDGPGVERKVGVVRRRPPCERPRRGTTRVRSCGRARVGRRARDRVPHGRDARRGLAAGPGAPGRLRHRRGGARRGRLAPVVTGSLDRGDAITRAGSSVGPRVVGPRPAPRPRAEAR